MSSLSCQFCNKVLDALSVDQRQKHYDDHLDSKPQSTNSKSPLNASGFKFTYKADMPMPAKFTRKLEPDIFWYPAKTTPPPRNHTPGLIPVLKKLLVKSHEKGVTRRAVLCVDNAVHISRESLDSGWGCGYRNFMIACAVLMTQQLQPMYFPLLDDPISPGVRNLQRWIEDAWKAGFDPDGARELKRLVGTSKWIGTADLYVAFTFRGIPAALVDFDLRRSNKDASVVVDWIVKYFTPPTTNPITQRNPTTTTTININDALRGASPVTCTDRMPLILQNSGHSRTIVGYEVSKKGTINLIVFDPSYILNKQVRNVAVASYAASSSSACTPQTSGIQNHDRNDVEDDEVIIISDSRDRISGTGTSVKDSVSKEDINHLDSIDTLKTFRLDLGKLKRKDQYQILYFPMSAPMTDRERLARKVVFSTKAPL